MKDDFIRPILVLTLVSLVVSGALALLNGITEPVIAKAAAERAEAAMFEIIPEADGFESVPLEGLPESILEVYISTNDVGFIFVVGAVGYGGEIRLLCGVGTDGRMIRCTTLEHAETKGLGSRITEQRFENQFIGVDFKLVGVEAITGATVSSGAYIGAVSDALAAHSVCSGR